MFLYVNADPAIVRLSLFLQFVKIIDFSRRSSICIADIHCIQYILKRGFEELVTLYCMVGPPGFKPRISGSGVLGRQ